MAESEKAKTAQGKSAKQRTIADIRNKKKAVTKKVYIQTDGEVANRIADLRQLFLTTRATDKLSNGPDKAPAIQAEMDRLVANAQDTVEVFVFRSVGRHAYDELVTTHAPTKEQKKEGADFNAETFPPALVAASCIDPIIPLEDATAIFNDPDWNGAELRALFFGALEVNTETGDIPLFKTGSDGTLNSLLSSLTQSQSESLTASM